MPETSFKLSGPGAQKVYGRVVDDIIAAGQASSACFDAYTKSDFVQKVIENLRKVFGEKSDVWKKFGKVVEAVLEKALEAENDKPMFRVRYARQESDLLSVKDGATYYRLGSGKWGKIGKSERNVIEEARNPRSKKPLLKLSAIELSPSDKAKLEFKGNLRSDGDLRCRFTRSISRA